MLFAFICLLFINCSNDEEPIQNQVENLKKPIVVVYYDSNDGVPTKDHINARRHYYTDNRIDSVVGSRYKSIYEYSGDLISYMNVLDKWENVNYEHFYHYDSQARLIRREHPDYYSDFTNILEYEYLEDGSVTEDYYASNSNPQGREGDTLSYNEIENSIKLITNTSGIYYAYYFDGKYAPFKNVVGYNQSQLYKESFDQNIVRGATYLTDGTLVSESSGIVIYDDEGYLISKTHKSHGEGFYYFYE